VEHLIYLAFYVSLVAERNIKARIPSIILFVGWHLIQYSPRSDRIQMLVHGDTYTSSYWTFPINGFSNYSYVAFSCERGLSSFAFDMIGAGLSTRPDNSSDIQVFVTANITASLSTMLKNGTISHVLGGREKKFSKVVAIGHSLGAVTLNWAAISLGSNTPFDAFVSTGHIHDPGFLQGIDVPLLPASEVDPARWGTLDPGYITTPNISTRAIFYAPDNSSFSSQVLMIDELTKDIGSSGTTAGLTGVYLPATGYAGAVAAVVGSEDQIHCDSPGNHFVPCNAAGVLEQEKPFYPDTRNLTAFVQENTGHDLNLHFSAKQTFQLFAELVQQLV
jgi:pimeloyl-ACP methyl ester carboxylesterase